MKILGQCPKTESSNYVNGWLHLKIMLCLSSWFEENLFNFHNLKNSIHVAPEISNIILSQSIFILLGTTKGKELFMGSLYLNIEGSVP